MFKTRLLSGIVLVILALFLIISGHEILLFATLAISCIGMFELYRVFKMEKTVLAGVDIWRQSFITVIYSGSFCRIL